VSKNRLRLVLWTIGVTLLCLLAIVYWQSHRNKYTIDEVSQALFQEGLLASTGMNLIEYPDGIKEYPLKEGMLTLPGHRGMITFYPKQHQLRSAVRYRASALRPHTYSEFIKGNVSVRIQPEVSEHDAQRFRHALDSLR